LLRRNGHKRDGRFQNFSSVQDAVKKKIKENQGAREEPGTKDFLWRGGGSSPKDFLKRNPATRRKGGRGKIIEEREEDKERGSRTISFVKYHQLQN